VIVNVGLARMVLILVSARIIVTMRQFVVVVLMRMPVDAVFDTAIRLDVV